MTATLKSITLILPSDMGSVRSAVRRAEEFVQECGAQDDADVSLVLRELLANAIVHGNGSIPARTVTSRIEFMGKGQFRITVEDEGEGFDFRCVDTSLPEDPRRVRRRGYVLICRICSGLEFNERGNRVTVLVDAGTGCDASRARFQDALGERSRFKEAAGLAAEAGW